MSDDAPTKAPIRSADATSTKKTWAISFDEDPEENTSSGRNHWSNWGNSPNRRMIDPDSEDPRSIVHRAGIMIGGALMVCVFGCFSVMMVMLPSTLPDNSRDVAIMVLVTFVGLALALIPLVGTWAGALIVYSAFKRPETLNNLRTAPDAPRFSESSLICFEAGLGSSLAVIVDHERGHIHFRNTHRERGKFIDWPQKWFSCPLSEVVQAKRHVQRVKGRRYESLRIETTHGLANVSPTMPNYTELCQYFGAS